SGYMEAYCRKDPELAAQYSFEKVSLPVKSELGELAWVFIDPAAHVGAQSSTSVLRVFGAGLVVGFVAARWATNETDKWLLHAAVCEASAAPAAHPDVIRVIAKSRPFAILRIAQDLMPRHAGHR
ncbi:MAG: hypothetical protein ACRD26_23015, partial [Vicinamibacterales bacterium]